MRGRTLQPEILGYTKGVNNLEVVKLIELAGRTAYKSQSKITQDSADKFIQAIRKRGHESVIEHSWFVFRLYLKGIKEKTINQLLLANDLLTLTERENEEAILVSGNARMFRDFFRSDYWETPSGQKDSFLRQALLKMLAENWPVLFEDLPIDKNIEIPDWIVLNPDLDFTLREKRKHWWVLVRLTGGSRAFTHQFVRHRRKTAFTQESQRYCDLAGFFHNNYFSVPLSIREAALFFLPDSTALEDWYLDKLKTIDEWYKELQDYLREAKEKGMTKGKVNEDARFLLPNAVCSEIVCSAPLEEWRWIFKMRTAPDVQWEVRSVMIKLLRKFQNIFPEAFDDFQIDEVNMTAAINFSSYGH